MLTDEQRSLVESAMPVVPKVIAAFWKKYPHLRKPLGRIDAECVANLAICKAARTYDPSKSKVTTYFSTAIRNALLKEIDKTRRLRYDSPLRVPLEMAMRTVAAEETPYTRLQLAIARLPPKTRRLVYARFYQGRSLRELGQQSGCDSRTIRRRLEAALKKLESLLDTELGLP
jgi:RNA polymerase sigma factor (sigma-70 family)